MLTIDEVSAVPLFSALPTKNLERLARTSADLHLTPGEFAVHEGGEPALFAVGFSPPTSHQSADHHKPALTCH